MTSQEFQWRLILALLTILNIALIAIIIEANIRSNWFERKYFEQPRLHDCPVKRSRLHRFFLALFTFPILKKARD